MFVGENRIRVVFDFLLIDCLAQLSMFIDVLIYFIEKC